MDQRQAEGQAEVDWSRCWGEQEAQADVSKHKLTDDRSVIVEAHLTDGTACWCDPETIREEGSADVVVHRSARQIAEQRDKLREYLADLGELGRAKHVQMALLQELADLQEPCGVGEAKRDPHLEGLVRYV